MAETTSYSDKLKRLLTTRGSCSTGGICFAVFPCFGSIRIKDVGVLALPVQEFQAEAIRRKCSSSANVEKGSTITTSAAEKVWQVEANEIKIDNPQWDDYLISFLIDVIAVDLGVKHIEVRCQLSRLMLYDEGTSTNQKKSPKNEPGKFGSLIICLPSDFRGGELEVYYKNEKSIYDFEKLGKTDLQFAAFFSDCLNRVQPVKSGFQICLIYDLICNKENQHIPTGSERMNTNEKTAELLELVLKKDQEKLIMLLEVEYMDDESIICVDKLDCSDQSSLNCLIHASKKLKHPMHIYLAMLKRNGSSTVRHFDDPSFQDFCLTNLTHQSGKNCEFNDIPIKSVDEIIGDFDPYNYGDDSIDDIPYPGVIVAVPHNKIFDFKAQYNYIGMVNELVGYLRSGEHVTDSKIKEDCSMMHEIALTYWETGYSLHHEGIALLEALVLLEDKENTRKVLEKLLDRPNNFSRNDKVLKVFENVSNYIGIDELHEILRTAIETSTTHDTSHFLQLLENLATKFNHAGMFDLIELTLKKTLEVERRFLKGLKLIKDLSIKYQDNVEDNQISGNGVLNKMKTVISNLAIFLTTKLYELLQKQSLMASSHMPSFLQNPINYISDVYELAYSLNIEDCLKMISKAAMLLISNDNLNHTKTILRELKKISNSLTNSVALAQPTFLEMSKAIFQDIKARSIKNRGVRMQPWSTSIKLETKCSCEDCQLIDVFLGNICQKIGCFSFSIKRRQHIEKNLDGLQFGELDLERRLDNSYSPPALLLTKSFSSLDKKIQEEKEQLEDLLEIIPNSEADEVVKQLQLITKLSSLAADDSIPAKRLKSSQ